MAWGARLLICVCAAGLLASGPSFAGDDRVARGRRLIRGDTIKERQDGVRLLIEANSTASIQPLEDAIRLNVKDLDRYAKTLDELDVSFDKALGYWESARTSGDREFYDLAKRYLADVKADWEHQSAVVELLFETALMAGDGFAAFTDRGALATIEAGARSESHPLIRQWYIRGLARPDRPEGVPFLLKLLTGSDPMARSLAARALIPSALDRRVFAAASVATADKAWPVRMAAYETIARVPADFGVPKLVEATGRESGDVARVLDALLASHVGVSFVQNPRQWVAWWKENGESFLAGAFSPPEAPAARETTRETFFSIPIESTNVLFVLDYSSSMEADLAHSDPRNDETRTKHALPATRLGVTQAETIRAIRGLPAEAAFGVVVFSDKAKRWSERPMAATDSNKKAAVTWLLAQKTGWLTNIWDGLRTAFGDLLRVGAPSGRFLDLPDTIVFLTDGNPTRGRIKSDDTLASLVTLWNAPLAAVVHTVGVGDEHDVELLRSISEATLGTYRDLRKPASHTLRPRAGVPRDAVRPSTIAVLARAKTGLDVGEPSDTRARTVADLALVAAWSPEALALVGAALADSEEEVSPRVARRGRRSRGRRARSDGRVPDERSSCRRGAGARLDRAPREGGRRYVDRDEGRLRAGPRARDRGSPGANRETLS
jgi:hypothetical protein